MIHQTREYHDGWPLVDVVFELFPDIGLGDYEQSDNVALRVTIREALTEQEKALRRAEVCQWEEATLQNSGFEVWDPDKDDRIRKLKEEEEGRLFDLERIEDGEFGPSPVPPNISDDPTKVRALVEMRSMGSMLRTRGLSLECALDLDEFAEYRALFFSPDIWPSEPSELVEYWETLKREEQEGWAEEVRARIRKVHRAREARIHCMRSSDRRRRARILHDEARNSGMNFRLARGVEQVYRMKNLKLATIVAEKMLARGGVDTYRYERFLPLWEFKKFSEVFRDHFDLKFVEPDDEEELESRVKDMFR